jgi:hypothetical protein
MAPAMARQEDDLGLADPPTPQHVGRLAPGARNRFLAPVCQARQIIDARSADDSENGFGHDSKSSVEAGKDQAHMTVVTSRP